MVTVAGLGNHYYCFAVHYWASAFGFFFGLLCILAGGRAFAGLWQGVGRALVGRW